MSGTMSPMGRRGALESKPLLLIGLGFFKVTKYAHGLERR